MPKLVGDIDPVLNALGGRGKYQLLQLFVIHLGSFGAAYQLLDNIFIGRDVLEHRCARPSPEDDVTGDLADVDWNSSHVAFDECAIRVNGTSGVQTYDCLYGQWYDYPWQRSFRTEFDLVCDNELLGSLAQSFVIMGQGVGAVIASIFSDRFGRKKVLVGSQLGLMALGFGIGLAPNYAVLATLKFIIGGFQQGVVTGMATMAIEWFPVDSRHIISLVSALLWGSGASSMALVAYLMRYQPWRYLQYALSSISVIFLIQLWYLDESLRWLVANGRKKEILAMLKRAAKTNNKDYSTILSTLAQTHKHYENIHEHDTKSADSKAVNSHVNPAFTIQEKPPGLLAPSSNGVSAEKKEGEKENSNEMEQSLKEKKSEQLTVLDIFRHKRLLKNALVLWVSWFTTAFSFFGIYLMSTTLHGNRFLNYFLTALMELPAGFIFFFLVNRVGRKTVTRLFFLLGGIGLVSSSIFRTFEDNSSVFGTLSVVGSLVGMVGASGMFNAVFFYTPEVFPTNMRNQSVGVSSFCGRLGGMIAPFMSSLAEIAVWAPGTIIGSLCFLVVFLFRFLPESKGRELPQTLADIKAWYRKDDSEAESKESKI